MERELMHWLGWSMIFANKPSVLKKIYLRFNDPKKAWEAGAVGLRSAGLNENEIIKFFKEKGAINLKKESEKLENKKITLLPIDHEDYPELLKEIYDPPPLLYAKGDTKLLNRPCLAVVGTRKISPYGKSATCRIISGLRNANLTIVSGLALGTDALAHQCALENSLATIAVLGSGLDENSLYPKNNLKLAEKIVSQGGLLISEIPLNTPPQKFFFPLRNRIISGISLGVLVIEAPEKSGALITAGSALDQNREIFCIPGSIFSQNSQGTNKCLAQGAKLVQSAEDIVHGINLEKAFLQIENKKILPENPEEEQIISSLIEGPLHIDKISQKTNLESSRTSSCLTLLEMKGLVKNMGGMNYVLIKKFDK